MFVVHMFYIWLDGLGQEGNLKSWRCSETLELPGRQKVPSQKGFCRVQNSVRLICAENPLGFDHVSINRVRPLFHHSPRHRCSTTHQDTAAQTDELKGAGCVEVFAEKVSSRAPLEKRHQLRACLDAAEGR